MEYVAKGTQINIKLSGDTDFAPVTQVRNINLSGLTKDMLDTSSHDNVANHQSFRTKKPGMKDSGTAELEILYDPADSTHVKLIDAYVNDEEVEYEIVYPDDVKTAHKFAAYVSDLDVPANFEDTLLFNVVLTNTGAPEFSYTPSPLEKDEKKSKVEKMKAVAA